MKVMIIHSGSLNSFPGGEKQVALSDKKWLEKKGVDVQFYIVKKDYSKQDSEWKKKIIAGFENIWSGSSISNISEKILEFKPDIVHFHGLFPFLSASVLKYAHELQVGVVQTLHNGRWICLEGGFYRNGEYCVDCVGENRFQGVLNGCNRGVAPSLFFYLANMSGRYRGRLFQWVDRFIAVSDFIKDQHVQDGFPSGKIVVKNNCIDISKFSGKSYNSQQRNGIAYVSRISESKGVGLLKKIIPKLQIPINIVGDGPDLSNLKEFCVNNDHKHVVFWGKQTQEKCFSIISSVKCTVITSQCGEAFSLVAIESMALSTPVVAANIGGLGPLVRNSEGGIAVQYNAPDAYIDSIRKFLDDPEYSRSIGCKGRKYVEKNFNAEMNIKQLIQIYHGLLREKGKDVTNL